MRLLRGGAGEPVLFLHAAGGAGAWLPFHSRLAGAGFEVIAPDHPGFGQSDDFPEVEAIDDLVYHYLEVLDLLGFGPGPGPGLPARTSSGRRSAGGSRPNWPCTRRT